MELETSRRGTAVVVRPVGRLNMVAAPEVRRAIDGLVADGESRIVMDLTDTGFVDSSGLGALVAGLRTTRQAGGDLRIAAPGEQVLTALRLTNLDRILRPHGTVEDAIDGW
jgi:anti-anti-sigma factor